MDSYESYLEESITNLHFQKTVFEYICNEIQVAYRRLEMYSTNKERFEREKVILNAKDSPANVDLKEVDDLISKAQQLLQGDLKNPMKSKCQKSKQQAHISEKIKNKRDLKKPSFPVAKSSKIINPRQRQKALYPTCDKSQLGPIKTNIVKESSKDKETLYKESMKCNSFVSYNADFISAYKESKRHSKRLQTTYKKFELEVKKSQKQFLGALCDVGVDKKPCYIERVDHTNKVLTKLKPSSQENHFCYSNLKEWLVHKIELEIENQRLEFLTLYSKILRDCLINNDTSITNFRLIHWQLSRTLPVLVVDENMP